MTLYEISVKNIEGEDRSLGDYQGKVLLIVNTASECGYTPQYAGLQRLHQTYRQRGFSVLGFPSNDFGAQEPGTEEQIKTFCTSRYDVTFPLFAKVKVKGQAQHPLFALLTQAPPAGEVQWNFNKFLVGKDGKVLARFGSKVTPESPELKQAIEQALSA